MKRALPKWEEYSAQTDKSFSGLGVDEPIDEALTERLREIIKSQKIKTQKFLAKKFKEKYKITDKMEIIG